MEYAEESKETTYFDEEAAAAKEAVEGASRYFDSRVDGRGVPDIIRLRAACFECPLSEEYIRARHRGETPTEMKHWGGSW